MKEEKPVLQPGTPEYEAEMAAEDARLEAEFAARAAAKGSSHPSAKLRAGGEHGTHGESMRSEDWLNARAQGLVERIKRAGCGVEALDGRRWLVTPPNCDAASALEVDIVGLALLDRLLHEPPDEPPETGKEWQGTRPEPDAKAEARDSSREVRETNLEPRTPKLDGNTQP